MLARSSRGDATTGWDGADSRGAVVTGLSMARKGANQEHGSIGGRAVGQARVHDVDAHTEAGECDDEGGDEARDEDDDDGEEEDDGVSMVPERRATPELPIEASASSAISAFGAGGKPVVRYRGRHAVLAGTETLAGAIVTMDECVRNLVAFTGCDVAEAIRAASLRPAQLLGEDHTRGHLQPGARADIVILTPPVPDCDDADSLGLQPLVTLVGGAVAWSKWDA